jgi:hypothetical protein
MAPADEGIWEIRGASQHFVHSKVMTWVAFERSRARRMRRRGSGRTEKCGAENP